MQETQEQQISATALDDEHAREAIRLHLRIAFCYNLLMREARNRINSRWNLTLPQFDALAALARSEERGATFVTLSRSLLVTSGNLTGIVDRLAARKLVYRVSDPEDRRVKRIRLTAKGRAVTRRMLPRHTEDIGRVLSFMSIDVLRELSGLLDILKSGLNHLD